MLKPAGEGGKNSFIIFIDRNFDKLHKKYEKTLENSLNYLPVTAVFGAIVLISLVFLYTTSKSELAPPEDQGVIIAQMTMAPNASIYQTQLFSNEYFNIVSGYPEAFHIFRLDGQPSLNSSFGGIVLKPLGSTQTYRCSINANRTKRFNANYRC